MSADFSRLAKALGDEMVAHADRDGLTGAKRAVFMARGGHAPGQVCPSAPPAEERHHYLCRYPDDECYCGIG